MIDINLKSSNTVRLFQKYVFETGQDIELNFITSYDLSNGSIVLKNNIIEKSFPFSSLFKVPDEFLFESRLCVSVKMQMQGKTIKHWELSPLKIIEKDNGFEFQDELTVLSLKNEELEKRIKSLEDKHKIIK